MPEKISAVGFFGINFEIYPGGEFMMIRSFRRFVQIKVKMQISTGDEVSKSDVNGELI